MNPDLIDRTEAGRTMDVLIATMVMGLEIAGPEAAPLRFVQMGTTVHPDHVPKFSTTIACAWEVVESMQESGDWSLDLQWDDQRDPQAWSACFLHRTGGVFHPRHGDTAPLAICRAALEALDWENR